MKSIYSLTVIITIFALAACNATKRASKTNISDLEALKSMMTGSFNSSAQAEQDTNYYDITLHMYPIWENKGGHWLYVEQAVTKMQDRPYRQRVYRLEEASKGTIKSYVYTLKEPKKYIAAWKDSTSFAGFTEEDIELKEGCEVVLQKQKDGTFSGKTGEKTCPSALRGASYATSIVSVMADKIISWDQGWNANDEQVWGAEIAGYEFMKLKANKY